MEPEQPTRHAPAMPPSSTFLRLRLREGGVEVEGRPRFGVHQDLAAPGGSEGIFVEWEWDGAVLRFRNCRHGHYPLHYHATADTMILSPSLARVLESGAPRDFDDIAVATFLRRGCCVGDDTPFRDIHLLPPHATGEWRPGQGLRLTTRPRRIQPRRMDPSEAMDAFGEVFREAIRRRPPVGEAVVPLSGGRDSRHVLLGLCGAFPGSAVGITQRHLPPRRDDDATCATLLAEAMGLPHTILDHPPSAIGCELRKNPPMNFATDWSGWFFPVLDHLRGRDCCLYSGYGGDTLARGRKLSPDRVALWQQGRVQELAGLMAEKRLQDLTLGLLLTPSARARLDKEGVRARLADELGRHLDQPNPDLSFTFDNGLRRRTGPLWFPVSTDQTRVYVPFLDADVHELLASLPHSMMLDTSFHTEVIHRAAPQFREVPFAATSRFDREAPDYFRRFAREMLDYVRTRGDSRFFDLNQVAARLAAAAVTGDGRSLRWWNPFRVLALLQLEETVDSAARLHPITS